MNSCLTGYLAISRAVLPRHHHHYTHPCWMSLWYFPCFVIRKRFVTFKIYSSVGIEFATGSKRRVFHPLPRCVLATEEPESLHLSFACKNCNWHRWYGRDKSRLSLIRSTCQIPKWLQKVANFQTCRWPDAHVLRVDMFSVDYFPTLISHICYLNKT